jgi:hypothetical protein
VDVITKLKDMIIFKDEQYNTFPNAVLRKDGTILVGFRRARDTQQQFGRCSHIDPASKAVFVTSRDGGSSWDPDPSLIYDPFSCGVQDPCLKVLGDGSLFCTFFTWKMLTKEDAGDKQQLDHNVLDRWVGRLEGLYSIRSADGGLTWDEPIRIEEGYAVRGNPVELEDGTLVLPTYVDQTSKGNVHILASSDRGATWRRLAKVTHDDYWFHEPNLYHAPSGKLVLFLRSRNLNGSEENGLSSPLFTCESLDGGGTWSDPVKRDYYSPSPFHALPLHNGKVLITYGYRFEPFGIRAFVLDGECSDWVSAKGTETVLRDDGASVDIGYTSAVQLEGGDILVTYYYHNEEPGSRYIAGTLCRVDGEGWLQ